MASRKKSPSRPPSGPPRTATLSAAEVRRALDLLARRAAPPGEDPLTRLAWRPAWSIRSRRGALAPLLALFRRQT